MSNKHGAKTIYTELDVARELEKLVRLFERSVMVKPGLKQGLSAACELTKLWSMKYAPGDKLHPFHAYPPSAAEVFARAARGEIKMGKPMPIGETEGERHARAKATRIAAE